MTTKTVRERRLDGEFGRSRSTIGFAKIRVEKQAALLAALAEEHGLTNHPKLKLLNDLVDEFAWRDDFIEFYERCAELLNEYRYEPNKS